MLPSTCCGRATGFSKLTFADVIILGGGWTGSRNGSCTGLTGSTSGSSGGGSLTGGRSGPGGCGSAGFSGCKGEGRLGMKTLRLRGRRSFCLKLDIDARLIV